MKTTSILLALSLVMMISNNAIAQNQTRANSEIQVTAKTLGDTLVYTVYGMDCPGCAGSLEKQVNKIESVRFSEANWLKQELKIVLVKDSALNESELEKRVKKANFTLEKGVE